MISIRIISTPAALAKLQAGAPDLVARLQQRMTLAMFKLQSRIVGETIPEMFPNGAPNIAATVRANPAELEGAVIRGSVEAGGPRTTKRTLKSGAVVDYAAVQEFGISHSFEILPFNARALRFLMEGKVVFAKRVTHPGLEPRPYMRQSLEAAAPSITEDLQQAINEFLNE